MLKQRLLVAAVGLPALALLLFVPERAFSAIVTLVIALGTAEMLRVVPRQPDSDATPREVILGGAGAAGLLAASLRTVEAFPAWMPLAFLALAVFALALLLWPPPDGPAIEPLPLGMWWAGAVLYLGVLGAHWLLLRAGPDGTFWILVVLAVAFSTDTAAYATGRLVGRHILWRAVSPTKTWEGAAGGMLVGGAVAVALPLWRGSGFTAQSSLVLAAFALVLPFAGIAGDFLESAVKRRMDVKDMSSVLPGHGGLLDRLDSLLLIGPCLYWILQWAIRPSV